MTPVSATTPINHNRAIRLIREAVDKLSVDLRGYTVLTEVGSGGYLYTPIIAALAGSEKVIAWTSDSRYGKADVIKTECLTIARELGVAQSIEIFQNERSREHISEADIITNSGFLRPLDQSFLKAVKPGAVIPLMYESWELRATDIDIDFCKTNGIPVAGTWENHPAIRVFDSAGALAVKLANEAGLEVFENRIAVWSHDHFGEVSCTAFRNAGARTVKMYDECTDEWWRDFQSVDFIYLCDYKEGRPFFGPNGILNLKRMKDTNKSFSVIHLYGDVDNELLKREDVAVFPDRRGFPQQMTYTLGYLGPKPIIDLQVAGFRVAQDMLENKISDLTQVISSRR
jgi:hypothetical protein